jgi:hypothetical protein
MAGRESRPAVLGGEVNRAEPLHYSPVLRSNVVTIRLREGFLFRVAYGGQDGGQAGDSVLSAPLSPRSPVQNSFVRRYLAKKDEMPVMEQKPGRHWGVIGRQHLPLGKREDRTS